MGFRKKTNKISLGHFSSYLCGESKPKSIFFKVLSHQIVEFRVKSYNAKQVTILKTAKNRSKLGSKNVQMSSLSCQRKFCRQSHFWAFRHNLKLSEIFILKNVVRKIHYGELCTWFDNLDFFTFMENLYPLVCSIVSASLKAWGHKLRDCNKG